LTTSKKIRIELREDQSVFFFSDAHLGIATAGGSSRERENKLIECLDKISGTAAAVFFVGDLFEFWFEYRSVVPKGYVRIISRLLALKEKGIAVYMFTGNHDLWMGKYFEEELGIPVFHDPLEVEINQVRMLVGHGDGLGPGDNMYKLLKKVFRSSLCQWLFRWLHPDIGTVIARTWSLMSRTPPETELYHGDDKERILLYARKKRKQTPYDYFIFGHRHLPIDKVLPEGGRYLNIGDWMYHFTYIEYNGREAAIHHYTQS